MSVSLKKSPREVIEGKKSKTLRAHIKNQQNMLLQLESLRGVTLPGGHQASLPWNA